MKKQICGAAFTIVAAGSVGVAALSNISMKGSDTLKNFTLSVLSSAVCPAAVGIQYQGGGSGVGVSSMLAGSQTVAPSTVSLSFTACSANDPSKSEGIGFAAYEISMAVSRQHLAACQVSKDSTDCSSTPNSGLKQSGTLAGGTYTLGANSQTTNVQAWQDVLRLIYLGLPNTAGRNPGAQNNTGPSSFRDCNSAARQDLVNHWGNLFENECEATGGNCTQLTHAYRRDFLSNTTDLFRELINAQLYPFCNDRFAGDTTAVDYPTTLSSGAPIFEDPYQDFDPIRRVCAGGQNGGGGALPTPITNADGSQSQPDFPAAPAEQVCSPKGTLGLVLTIAPPFFNGQTSADVYPTKPCLKGKLVFGPAPKLPGTSKSTLCPNGDVTLGNSASDYDPATGAITASSNVCLVPAASDGDLRCINGKNNFNAPLDPPFGVIPAAQRDGRVFNLHLYSSTGTYKSDSNLGAARNIVGNFSRLHATRTMLTAGPTCPGTAGDGRCCSALDANSHIGCLVEADPCSFGFAGGSGKNATLQTSAGIPEAAFGADIAGIQDSTQCVGSAQYPLSRRTYFNTLIGFENVNGQELQLAKCFAGSANGFSSLLESFDLVALQNGPVCQDFAQENLCPNAAPASDACANNPAGIPTQH